MILSTHAGQPLSRTITIAMAVIGILLVLTGCASGPATTPPTEAESSVLTDHDLAGLDARQIIERLDTMPLADRPADLMASIRPDQLILSDDRQRETSLPMPAERFYVSFAPYVNKTHACHYHSLTTCTGELQDAEVHVKVAHAGTGKVIVDKAMRTYDNGFLGCGCRGTST